MVVGSVREYTAKPIGLSMLHLKGRPRRLPHILLADAALEHVWVLPHQRHVILLLHKKMVLHLYTNFCHLCPFDAGFAYDDFL